MKKEKLLKLLESETDDIKAIKMILNNYSGYIAQIGAAVSFEQFDEVAKCFLEWIGTKRGEQDRSLLIDFFRETNRIRKEDPGNMWVVANCVDQYLQNKI